MSRTFMVNWTIFGCVEVQADHAEAARESVRHMSFLRLSNIGSPDYELEVSDVTGRSGSGGGLTEGEIHQLNPTDSMAELFGE